MPPAKRPPSKRKSRAGPQRDMAPLVGALAEAAWREADSALAEALIECERALAAPGADARQEALELLSLALTRAARRRGLTSLGTPGAVEPFDPARHELIKPSSRLPKRVRIASAGIARGAEVLIKARATTLRAKRV